MELLDHLHRLNEFFAQSFMVKPTKDLALSPLALSWSLRFGHLFRGHFLDHRFFAPLSLYFLFGLLVLHLLIDGKRLLLWRRHLWILSSDRAQKLDMGVRTCQFFFKPLNFFAELIHNPHFRVLVFCGDIGDETCLGGIVESWDIFLNVEIRWREASDHEGIRISSQALLE